MFTAAAAPAIAFAVVRFYSCSYACAPILPATAANDDDDNNNNKEEEELKKLKKLKEALPAHIHSRPKQR